MYSNTAGGGGGEVGGTESGTVTVIYLQRLLVTPILGSIPAKNSVWKHHGTKVTSPIAMGDGSVVVLPVVVLVAGLFCPVHSGGDFLTALLLLGLARHHEDDWGGLARAAGRGGRRRHAGHAHQGPAPAPAPAQHQAAGSQHLPGKDKRL